MAKPDDEVQSWLTGLSFKAKRKLASAIKREADDLSAAIKAKAPRGKTGNLAESVQVRRRRNDLDLEVTAGGDLTTRSYERSTDYSSTVVIGSGDTAGRSKVSKGQGSGVTYDYSRAVEFGTVNESAQPFFWPTYRERKDGIRQRISEAAAEAVGS